jgi:hypothetical protein
MAVSIRGTGPYVHHSAGLLRAPPVAAAPTARPTEVTAATPSRLLSRPRTRKSTLASARQCPDPSTLLAIRYRQTGPERVGESRVKAV